MLMSDSMSKSDPMLNVVGAKGDITTDELLSRISTVTSKMQVPVQAFDASAIFGKNHLIAAFHHAQRAFEQNRNRTRTIEVETLLYAAGLRQISRALERVGVGKNTKNYAIAIFHSDEVKIQPILDELGLVRDDSVLDWTSDTELEAQKNPAVFGIGKDEIEAAGGAEKIPMLVLERVALLDVD